MSERASSCARAHASERGRRVRRGLRTLKPDLREKRLKRIEKKQEMTEN